VVSVAETGRVWPHRLASCAGVGWSLVPSSYTPVVLPQPPVYIGGLWRVPPVVIAFQFRRYAETCNYYDEVKEGLGLGGVAHVGWALFLARAFLGY